MTITRTSRRLAQKQALFSILNILNHSFRIYHKNDPISHHLQKMDVKIAFCTNYLQAFFSHMLTFNDLDYQTQVDSKPAGQPEHTSLNQCQLIATKSLTSARYLLFLSTSDGTCFSHDKREKFTRFTVKLASLTRSAKGHLCTSSTMVIRVCCDVHRLFSLETGARSST